MGPHRGADDGDRRRCLALRRQGERGTDRVKRGHDGLLGGGRALLGDADRGVTRTPVLDESGGGLAYEGNGDAQEQRRRCAQ